MTPLTPPRSRIDRAQYLAHAVADVRARGFVPAAEPDKEPTWQAALARLRAGGAPAPGDVRRAHEILGWVASLRPRDPDGYRANVRACLAHEHLTEEDLPLAASAVRAFNRHLFFEIRGRRHRSLLAGLPRARGQVSP